MDSTRSEHGFVAARRVEGLGAVVDVLRGWAPDRALAAWVAGDGGVDRTGGMPVPPGGDEGDRGRWSVVGMPTGVVGAEVGLGIAPPAPGGWSAGFLADGERVPFAGGWIGWLSYDLGRGLEASGVGAACRAARDRDWGGGAWLCCPGALVHDAWTGAWWAVGNDASAREVERAAREAMRREATGYRVGAMGDPRGRAAYEGGVRDVLERIGAGEVFQVNLARRLTGAFEGDPRQLFADLCERVGPRHGCYAESMPGVGGAHAVLSLSPELFLDVDLATGAVATRPMKGTRAIEGGDARELFEAAKDRAELVMIVDLMRNDLGRVARFGSVRVAEARAIERHAGGGVLQAVAEVRGVLREGVGLEGLLRATFPPGSVTGAPKVRAMRVIDELEGSRRGPYCGSAGFVSDCGRAMLNVAIRTAGITGKRGSDGVFRGATLDYSVGAGIVADSDPAAEFEETAQKAWAVRGLGAEVGACRSGG